MHKLKVALNVFAVWHPQVISQTWPKVSNTSLLELLLGLLNEKADTLLLIENQTCSVYKFLHGLAPSNKAGE